MENIIISEDSLYSTLKASFAGYVKVFNSMVNVDERIPQVEAPTGLFLQQHLDNPQEETAGLSEQEDGFGE